MRALVQRVRSAAVRVAGETVGEIGPGLLVYVAVAPNDSPAQSTWLAGKVTRLRVFSDEFGKLNRDVRDAGGSVLLISAFTLLADASRGNRPSFDAAAGAAIASSLVERLRDEIRGAGVSVATGRFGADMQVESTNAGPICILLESPEV